ncbi:MAG: metallophosphoesterase [Thermoanaerobaculaceae bacterium]|jgi:hypothetical protein|nr:metallophosphoesterase [Thermoanaerobaculaceae bacterium]
MGTTATILLLSLILLGLLLGVDALSLGALRAALPRGGPRWLRKAGAIAYWGLPVLLVGWLVGVVAVAGVPSAEPSFVFFAVLALGYFPKLAIVAVSAAATAVLTPWLLVRRLRARGGAPVPELRAWRLRPVALAAAVAGALVLGGVVQALTVGRGAITVSRRVVELPGLPADLDGLRIVHLSDFHLASLPDGDLTVRLVAAVNGLQPDLIVFTGDLGAPEEVEAGPEILGHLRAPLGCVAVLGNHDLVRPGAADDVAPSAEDKAIRTARQRELLAARGFTLLHNGARLVERSGVRLAVLGVAVQDPHHGFADADLPAALAAAAGADYKLLLMHNPLLWDTDVLGRVDVPLTLAGHTHAGQVAVELGPLRWSLARGMFPRWHGLYEVAGQVLHVSSGVGYVGLPFRLGCPSEIALLELRRSEGKPKVVSARHGT